jgi:UrcA family protein
MKETTMNSTTHNTHKTFGLNFATVAAVAALALLGSNAARAGDAGSEVAPPAPALKVNFADLNLDSPAGARALVTRIGKAAERVCGPLAGTPDRIARFQACLNASVARAVAEVGHPAVSANYAARYGKPQGSSQTVVAKQQQR